MRRSLAGLVLVLLAPFRTAIADEPQRWEQLFFPFPIVGAPPQLEQQVQIFDSTFHGSSGGGNVLSLELAWIATPHLGFVVDVPFQIGGDGQATGFQDIGVLVQYLAAGSLRWDAMVSTGVSTILPTGRSSLSAGDWYVGPFVFAAKRFWRRLTFEVNAAALVPVVKGESARQVQGVGLVSLLLTPVGSSFPVYAQVEADSTTFLGGTSGLPAGATRAPVESLFLAPEVFIGPFASPISDGTRLAAGVFVNLSGDPEQRIIYTVTVAFDVPNRYGY